MPNRIRETALIFLKGCVIGVANIIPGVSGGTIAIVLGIYGRLIESISCFFGTPGKRKEYGFFLATVGAGAGIAIMFLANVMDFLLTRHFHITMFAFMGLIIGGIPSIWKAHGDMRVSTTRVFAFSAGMLVVIISSLAGTGGEEAAIAGHTGMPIFSWRGYLTLLFAGFLAGGGMIVPGISGSFILVLMGQYSVIISAIKGLLAAPLACVAAGAAAGIFVFSKIIKACLEKAPATTYYFITGLLAASLLEIFPGIPGSLHSQLFSGAALLTGAGISYLLSRISS